MDDSIQRQAAARAEELPGVTLDQPFGPEWDVYRVRGKVFMLHSNVTGKPFVNLKADPADSEALRTMYEQITPGYHMNKKHWISVYPGTELDRQFIEDLVTESYLLVIEKNVPKSRWPVNPQTFGRPAEI